MKVIELNINNLTGPQKIQLGRLSNKLDTDMQKFDDNVKLDDNFSIEYRRWKEKKSKLLVLVPDNDENMLIGYATINKGTNIPNLYILSKFYLLPEYRGQRLGHLFLTKVEDFVKKELKGRYLGLNVYAKNTIADKLYNSHQFKTIDYYKQKEL